MKVQLIISLIVFIVIGSVVFIVTLFLGKYTDNGFLENLLVELHGMVFDLLLIGILVTFFLKLAQRKESVQKYLDELDEIQNLTTEKETRRKRELILTLSKFGKKNLNLTHYYLQNINLSKIKLAGAKLSFAHLQEAILWKAQLQEAHLDGAQLQAAYLSEANLQKANLEDANLQASILVGARLKGANLQKANLLKANLLKAKLKGANLERTQLDEANFEKADLRSTKGLEMSNISQVKTLYEAKLDRKTKEMIEDQYPDLLKKPEL